MKLMYGKASLIQPGYQVFNYSGLTENVAQLRLLPFDNLGAFDERDFDMKYAQWILSDDNRFVSMFGMILTLANGNPVYLITNEDTWSMSLIESFMKLLQVRYGITGTLVQTEEDIECAGETDFNPYYGIRFYDEDYNRFMILEEQFRLIRGGQPYAV